MSATNQASDTPTDQSAKVSTQPAPTPTQPPQDAAFERSLSEDLLLGDEENFKQSYSDDEDNITVTVDNGGGVTAMGGHVGEDEDLASLDYSEDIGGW